MPHAHRGRYTHAKHSPETRVGSFAADVQQLSKSGRPRRRPVREAGFRDSGRRQILCGVLNKVLIEFDDFGARQARGRSGRFSDLPDRALETSRHEPPRREAKTRPSSTTRTTTMINLENESATTAATTKSITTRSDRWVGGSYPVGWVAAIPLGGWPLSRWMGGPYPVGWVAPIPSKPKLRS